MTRSRVVPAPPVFVALLAAAALLVSCATPGGPVHPVRPEVAPEAGAVEAEKISGSRQLISAMERGRLKIDAVGDGYHHGNRYFGINTRFSLVLMFDQPLSESVTPDRFTARVGKETFSFSRHNGYREYFTGQRSVTTPDLDSGPGAVTVFYRDASGEMIPVVSGDSVIIDTTAPDPPDLRLAGCSSDRYTLQWTPAGSPGGIEYGVQALDSGNWVKLPPGSVGSPPVYVDRRITGRVRVVAVDRAGNRAVSSEVVLECSPLAVTDMKILAPTHTLSQVNDRVITGQDALSQAYAVEVTANQPARLILVNVDAWGYGYRLFPTPCRTGRGFDGQMAPADPRRYPLNRDGGYYYLGLDEHTGLEEIYAILYVEEGIREKVWEWVQNEICESPSGSVPKGTRELPGIHRSGGKRQVAAFESKLDGLSATFGSEVSWTKRSFWHQ